jgi:RNA polymerase sigma-70 factor (ECF subfamily)
MKTKHGTTGHDLAQLGRNRAFVRGLARSLVQGDAEADDVAQDAWLSVLRGGPRDARSLRGWLAAVVRRRAIDRARRAGRRAGHERDAARRRRVPGPEEIAQLEEVRRRVVERVLALEEPYRAAILMRYYHDLSGRAAAEALGVPLQTYKTRLKRGLARLREGLERDGTVRDGRTRAALLALAGRGAPAGPGPVPILAVASLLLVGSALLLFPLGGDPAGDAGATPGAEGARAPRVAAGADARAGAAPQLAGRGSPTAAQALSARAAQGNAQGCWLVGKVTAPRGFRDEPLRVAAAAPGRGDASGRCTALAAADGSVRVDLAPLLAANESQDPLRVIQVTLDHPDYLRRRVEIPIPRRMRDVFHEGRGRAEVVLKQALDPAPFKIAGSVRLPTGRDPGRARLALFAATEGGRPREETPVDTARPGPDGRYVLRAPAAGPYLVVAALRVGLAPALRPQTALVDVRTAHTQVEVLAPDPGLEISGQVSSPAAQAPAHLSVRAELQQEGSPQVDWEGLSWHVDRFECDRSRALADAGGGFHLSGLGPYPYDLQVEQGVWQDGREIPTIFVGAHTYRSTLATAPANDVKLDFPWEVWLLRMAYENGDVQAQWVGIPWYARHVFVGYVPDDRGRVAAFVRPGSYTSSEHPFLSPREGRRIRALVTPNAWSRLTFSDRPEGASLDLHLTHALAGQTRYYEVSFSRRGADGRERWMRDRSDVLRDGDVLHLHDLTPGPWRYEVVPRARSVVDLSSCLLAARGEVEIRAGARNRVDVRLREGGYLAIPAMGRYVPSLGFPAVRKGLVGVHEVRWRVLDGRGQEQHLQVCRRDAHDDAFASPLALGALAYGFGHDDQDVRFWPPLPPGPYVLELWTKGRRKATLQRVSFGIRAGRTTRLAAAR